MSEYKTLDQWFPDGKPDGRRFTKDDFRSGGWFEPIFSSRTNSVNCLSWHGKSESGFSESWLGDECKFKEYTEPKKTKKVTLYKPVFSNFQGGYETVRDTIWASNKETFNAFNVAGWLSQEVEVECD